jgi:hypothetical protein
MAVSDHERNIAETLQVGEYGATRVVLSRDGSCVRMAFGRNGRHGPVFTGAVLLSPEAFKSLCDQVEEMLKPPSSDVL